MTRKVGRGGEAAWVDARGPRDALGHALASTSRVALDTEANGFHAYRPRLCLVQLARETPAGPEVALVDPLALDDDFGALAGVLEDPSAELILHGADYDIRLLKRDAGVRLRGLYDTQVAARLAGRSKTSLAHLAEEIAGVRLSKSARKTDWKTRPLPRAALGYAADDVRVLFAIRDAVAAELAALGRESWAEEEFRLLEQVEPAPEADEGSVGALIDRLPGSGRLGGRERAILLELARFRDAEARRRDRPPGFVLSSKALVEIARRGARDRAALEACGVPRTLVGRYGTGLLAAAAVGRDAPPLPPPPRERGRRAEDDEAVRARLKRLRRVRDRRAGALGLDPGLVATTAALGTIARERPADEAGLRAAGLRRWQAGLLGEELVAALG